MPAFILWKHFILVFISNCNSYKSINCWVSKCQFPGGWGVGESRHLGRKYEHGEGWFRWIKTAWVFPLASGPLLRKCSWHESQTWLVLHAQFLKKELMLWPTVQLMLLALCHSWGNKGNSHSVWHPKRLSPGLHNQQALHFFPRMRVDERRNYFGLIFQCRFLRMIHFIMIKFLTSMGRDKRLILWSLEILCVVLGKPLKDIKKLGKWRGGYGEWSRRWGTGKPFKGRSKWDTLF